MSGPHNTRYIQGVRGAKAHLKQRFRERYRMEVSNREIYAMIDTIKKGNVNFIRRTNIDTAVYGMLFRGEWIWVVYNSTIEFPITVLPKNEVEEGELSRQPQ